MTKGGSHASIYTMSSRSKWRAHGLRSSAADPCRHRAAVEPEHCRSSGGGLAMAIAIDTLAYARRLREAGFTEQQAEGQAQALAAAMTDSLATKQDLTELAAGIDARFAATKQDLRELAAGIDARFAATKQDLRETEARVDVRFAQVDARFAQ